jgi:hypothetical protein
MGSLFILNLYCVDELKLTLLERSWVRSNSVFTSLAYRYYGVRAWVISCLRSVQAVKFDMQRQNGVANFLVFVWAALKAVVANIWVSFVTW